MSPLSNSSSKITHRNKINKSKNPFYLKTVPFQTIAICGIFIYISFLFFQIKSSPSVNNPDVISPHRLFHNIHSNRDYHATVGGTDKADDTDSDTKINTIHESKTDETKLVNKVRQELLDARKDIALIKDLQKKKQLEEELEMLQDQVKQEEHELEMLQDHVKREKFSLRTNDLPEQNLFRNQDVATEGYFNFVFGFVKLPFLIEDKTYNEFTFSIWIYLSPSSSEERRSRYILTTKPKGCSDQISGDQGGISLYVNKDGTENQSLILEYMTVDGCESLETLGIIIPLQTWTHVAVTLSGRTDPLLKLYVNGEVIATTADQGDSSKTFQFGVDNESTVIGDLKENGGLFEGYITMLAIWKGASLDDEKMRSVYQAGLDPGKIVALGDVGNKPGNLNYLYKFAADKPTKEEIQAQTALTNAPHLQNPHTRNRSVKQNIMHQALHRNPFEDIDEDDTDDLDDNTVWKPIGPGRFPEYRDGTNKFIPNPDVLNESDNTARLRRDAIRNSMKHAWNGYKKSAWGADEMLPISEYGHDNWGGMGVTLVDALDTLWLMDMKDEFWEARNWVRDHLDHDHVGGVSVFETTIRSLGGLLSAYDWSGDKVFLEKAEDLGRRLGKAFDTETGFPQKNVILGDDFDLGHHNLIEPGFRDRDIGLRRRLQDQRSTDRNMLREGVLRKTHHMHNHLAMQERREMYHQQMNHQQMNHQQMNHQQMYHHNFRDSPRGLLEFARERSSQRKGTNIAEVGSVQIEFRYLAKTTGYDTKSERAFATLQALQSINDGLFPIYLDPTPPIALSHSKIAFGANGDSFYEYMLKMWLQSGKKESMYREMYDYAMDGLHNQLISQTDDGLTYIAEKDKFGLIHKMDHLTCFMGGTLALGAYTHPDGLESPKAQRDLKTAKALTYTCYQSYAGSKTGIGPEIIRFRNGKIDYASHGSDNQYILRPEVIESYFYLNKLTGDPTYREWGWEAFQAIERFCKTDAAYGGLENVNRKHGHVNDKMESFFMAETLKYLYLLFDPDTEVDILNKHVFNTEAHPLRRFDVMDQGDEVL